MGKKIVPALLACAALLCGCARTEGEAKEYRQVYAMDTVFELTVYGENASAALDSAEAEIRRLEKIFSVRDEAAEACRLNADGHLESASDELIEAITRSAEVSEQTLGAFDITVYPLMCAWGYDDGELAVPSDAELSAALARVGWKNVVVEGREVTLLNGAQVDFGAMAKGYTADRVADVLKACGVESAVLDLGGNVRLVGTKPGGENWSVGIADPNGGVKLVLSEGEMSVVTSGGYQRYFVENGVSYHHILDPRTGRPAESTLASVSVICADGTRADMLSTALFVMGADGAKAYWREYGGFEAVLIYKDGTTEKIG